jgi:hypothetical protein
MIHTACAIAVAAIAAALFVAFPSLSPQVGAVAQRARAMDAFRWLSRVTFVSLRPSASPMPIRPAKSIRRTKRVRP